MLLQSHTHITNVSQKLHARKFIHNEYTHICSGGGVNNCSVGYNPLSDVCGLCDVGYYKWRNECVACSADAWYKLLLAIVALGVITVAFFAISSARVSH